MGQNPSTWAKRNAPIGSCQQTHRYIHDSLTYFGAATTIITSVSPHVPVTLTQTVFITNEPSARILTISFVSDATAVLHTGTLRINGTDNFGQTITEDVSFSQAASLPRSYFTRNAFKTVTSSSLIANTGSGGADTISLGITTLAATMGTAGTQLNGASATHYHGFALMLQVKTSFVAATPTALTCEVSGVSVTLANVAAVLNRGAGHWIDAEYGVLIPQETTVATGAGIQEFILHIQTNRGE